MAKRILIVEDHPLLSEILCRHLGYLGLEVLIARTGDGALRKAAEQSPHVILLDLSLPDRDGLEVAALIRDNPMTCRIPIIAVSGHTYLKAEAVERGCDEFLTKPFLLLDLVIRIRSFLSRN